MSADNGIYILKLKDQSRVIHAQAIENLYQSLETFSITGELIPTRILEYFYDVIPMTFEEANQEATKLEEEILNDDFCPILEYGINIFEIDKTWDEIYNEAKVLFEKEKITIALSSKKNVWMHNVKKLNEIFGYV